MFLRGPEDGNFTYQFHSISWPSLKSLKDRLVHPNAEAFSEKHGGTLTLLGVLVNNGSLWTLLHFYDYELCCFTFQDYHISLTLKEYSHFLKITEHIFFTVPHEPNF